MKGLAVLAGVTMLMLAGATWVAAQAARAPEPNVVPTTWQLDIQYQTPAPISVAIPGKPGKQTFWYMVYTVANKTGADQVFVPAFTLYTDTGQVLHSGQKVPPTVFKAIQARTNDPLLKDMSDVTGTLLQGEDNAKEGVAIFTDLDGNARRFDIFVGGLSGEAATVKLPVKINVEVSDLEGNTSKVLTDTIILHKTLQLSYDLPGEAKARFTTQPRMAEEKWVMR